MSEQTIDVTDTRVVHIAEEVGATPQEILTEAEQAAAQYGDTVSDELDGADAVVNLLDGMTFADDSDAESDDDDDDDDSDEELVEQLLDGRL